MGAAGEYQVVLKEIDLPIVGHQQCQDSLRRTRVGRRFQLDDSFICAGGIAGKDTCKGDGGSPLVCQSKGDPFTYVQAWMDGEERRLNQEVDAAIQNADSLTGRRRAEVLARGARADNTLQYYNQCTVAWTPVVDLSNFGRETDSLTADGGVYSNPHPGPPGGLTAPVTEGPAPHSAPQPVHHSVPHNAPHSVPQQAPESYPETTYEVEPSSLGTSALSSQVKETVNY